MAETPMERQYNTLKKEAGDALLFFRVGDFYEMFHEDAKIASEILDITLTSRNKTAENPVPMCGIPVKASDKYIAKLTFSGQKVAIAEQVSDPNLPGIVERKILSIITTGTTLSDQILDEKKNRFIASLTKDFDGFSFARCDLSTGEVAIAQMKDFEELIRMVLSPDIVEIIFSPQDFSEFSSRFLYFSGALSRHFPPENAHDFLISFFKTKTLKSLGIEKNNSIQKTLALLFSYLQETQKTTLSHISDISFLDPQKYVKLDHSTINNLELFIGSDNEQSSSLFSQIDATKTPMGSRLLRNWILQPILEKDEIEMRLSRIENLIENDEYKTTLQKALSAISDIERIIGKLAMNKTNPTDLLRLSSSLKAIEECIPILQNTEEENPWKNWANEIITLFSKK